MNSEVRRLWNQRYLGKDDFKRLAEAVNLRINDDELEHYEKEGYLVPRVRIFVPEETLKMKERQDWDGLATSGLTARYKALYDPWRDDSEWAICPDVELAHSFDRVQSPLLDRPRRTGPAFKAWSAYDITVDRHGHSSVRSTQEVYYAPWQVFALEHIRAFPDAWRNRHLIAELKDDSWLRKWLPQLPDPKQPLPRLDAAALDALGDLRHRLSGELHRTYAMHRLAGRGKLLSRRLSEGNEQRERRVAQTVQTDHAMDVQAILAFVQQAAVHADTLEQNERSRLAEVLDAELRLAMDWLWLLKRWDVINVAERARYPWLFKRHRYLEMRQDALRILRHYAANLDAGAYANVPEDLVEFLWHRGMFDVLDAVSRASISEEEVWLPDWLDTAARLRALSVSLEHLSKALAPNPNLTLTPLLDQFAAIDPYAVGRPFRKYLNLPPLKGKKGSVVDAKTAAQFRQNLRRLTGMKRLAKCQAAQDLLLSCLVRNYAVHRVPDARTVYSARFGDASDALARSLLHVWVLAQKAGWVK